MRKIAVILAGGEGHRAGGEVPKQFQSVAGHPIYQWSMKAFKDADAETEIILVCHPGAFDLLDILESEREREPSGSEWRKGIPFKLICGGRSRRESVANALMEIEADEDTFVAVHDSARPLVTADMIERGWSTAYGKGSAVPVVAVTDSLRMLDKGDGSSEPLDRSRYVAVQTPQIFRSDILIEAYRAPEDPAQTDDASIVQKGGFPIALYEGESTNLKVTLPADFLIADLLLKSRKD